MRSRGEERGERHAGGGGGGWRESKGREREAAGSYSLTFCCACDCFASLPPPSPHTHSLVFVTGEDAALTCIHSLKTQIEPQWTKLMVSIFFLHVSKSQPTMDLPYEQALLDTAKYNRPFTKIFTQVASIQVI